MLLKVFSYIQNNIFCLNRSLQEVKVQYGLLFLINLDLEISLEINDVTSAKHEITS